MEGKLQTCEEKRGPFRNRLSMASAHLCVCVWETESEGALRGGEKLNPHFISVEVCRSWKCRLVFSDSARRHSLHSLHPWQSVAQLHACVCVCAFVFPVASCQLLLDLASVMVLSGRRGNNATARPTWAQRVPEQIWATPAAAEPLTTGMSLWIPTLITRRSVLPPLRWERG